MRSRFRKLKTAVFLQPLKHDARKGFFFFFHRLPILHLPFPSQPCGHKGSSISVNRIKCSIDPSSHSILQDTLSTGPNKAPKLLNLAISAQFTQGILLFSARKILPPPVQTTLGAVFYRFRGHLVAAHQNLTCKSVFEPDIYFRKHPAALSCRARNVKVGAKPRQTGLFAVSECMQMSNSTSPVLTAIFRGTVSQRTDTANKNSLALIKKLVIVAQL